MTAIQKDFHDLRIEWVSGRVLWLKKQNDGAEVELPLDFRRILLFLYSRSFKKNVNKNQRRAAVKDMIKPGRVRKAILQVISSKGDNSLCLNENLYGSLYPCLFDDPPLLSTKWSSRICSGHVEHNILFANAKIR